MLPTLGYKISACTGTCFTTVTVRLVHIICCFVILLYISYLCLLLIWYSIDHKTQYFNISEIHVPWCSMLIPVIVLPSVCEVELTNIYCSLPGHFSRTTVFEMCIAPAILCMHAHALGNIFSKDLAISVAAVCVYNFMTLCINLALSFLQPANVVKPIVSLAGYDPPAKQITDLYKVFVSPKKMYLEPFVQRGLPNYHQACSYNVCSYGPRTDLGRDEQWFEYQFRVVVKKASRRP